MDDMNKLEKKKLNFYMTKSCDNEILIYIN